MNFSFASARSINQCGTFAELGWPGGGGRVPRGSYEQTLTTGTTHIIKDNNYIYSQLGELIADVSEEIEEIVWRVDSKIAEVRRTSGSTKKNLRFDYDAMGNRIAKHIYADNAFTQWETSTYYVRDASGNVMATYEREATGQTPPSSFRVAERHLYGSSRLGIDATPHEFIATNYTSSPEATRSLGQKHYEISNHLGNVLSVITDQKLPVVDANTVVSYAAVVLSATDYSPFGVGLYGRSWSEGYRYGFNGKEKDSEGMGGGGSTYDYGFRIYNPSLAKFLSVDPLSTSYPWYTPYQFAGNAPIWAIDLDGLEQAVVVRWYDQQGQCTGESVFQIRNTADRPLGQNNFMFLNLADSPANRNNISRLACAVTKRAADGTTFRNFLNSHTQGSGQNTLTDFQGNPIDIVDSQSNTITRVSFLRQTLCTMDQNLVNAGLAAANIDPRDGGACQNWIPNNDVIYFDDASSAFNSTLDPDNNSVTNATELNQIINKIQQNPDRIAMVTGNTSVEDDPGGIQNNNLSNNRAQTVFNAISSFAQIVGQVTNLGGVGSQNARANPTDQQRAEDRNATVTYNIPLQTN